MRHLVELSGESDELALAEAMAVSGALCSEPYLIDRDTRTLVLGGDFETAKLVKRLGLAWSCSRHLFSCHEGELEEELRGLSLPGKTFRVRTRRMGSRDSEAAVALTRRAGAILAGDSKVDLEEPDTEVRILMGQRLHVGILEGEIDRPAFESRKSEYRPFTSPISLHPKFARALVNLTGIKPGQTLLDPFCGTGGILIEAGLLGCNAAGGDIDPGMVEGSVMNLEALGIKAEVHTREMSEWESRVDAIATDPPYGRSASTAKEEINTLYARTFETANRLLPPGGRLAIVLPDKPFTENTGMAVKHIFPVRVHKSLTRFFCLFES